MGKQSLQILKNHTKTLNSLNNLAYSYDEIGEKAKALELYKEV